MEHDLTLLAFCFLGSFAFVATVAALIIRFVAPFETRAQSMIRQHHKLIAYERAMKLRALDARLAARRRAMERRYAAR